MIIDTKFGSYELLENYRDAFDIQKFEERYITEIYDKFSYIVGDISSEILRMKGFSSDPKSKNSYKLIQDYLQEACNMNCAYFILKRIKNQIKEQGEANGK